MQKSIFQKAMLTAISVLLLAIGLCILSKAGVEPVLAAFTIILLKGVIRFVYRLTVVLVSIAMTIYLFVSLLSCI